MLSSMALQSSINTTLITGSSFLSRKPSLKSFTTSVHTNSNPTSRNQRLSTTLAAPEPLIAETSRDTISSTAVEMEKAVVKAKQIAKPRLVLKFIWMEKKNIGLALEQSIPGHGTLPMSPYFFWPRKDAWEELKATLESKPWISQKMR